MELSPLSSHRGRISSNATVPPLALSFREIWRELHHKSALSIISLLKPLAVPGMIDERNGLKASIFPLIMTIPLLVEYQSDGSATVINIIPLAGEDMASLVTVVLEGIGVPLARWLHAAVSSRPTSKIAILMYRAG